MRIVGWMLAVSTPFLFFPDLLPQPIRLWVVASAAVAALVAGGVLVATWPRLRYFVWLLILATIVAWFAMPAHDDLALRHFAGIALGLLAMGAVARWCRTEARLTAAAALFVAAAAGAVIVGLASISVDTTKFINTDSVRARPLFTQLPRLQLGLPGLQNDGRVNTNALAGTALLVAPMCVALVFLPRRRMRHEFALRLLGIGSTVVVLLALGLTLSRTAWLAAWITLLVFSLSCRRWRRVIGVLAWMAMTAVAVAALMHLRSSQPDDFDQGVKYTQSSAQERLDIWRHAVAQLKARPIIGIGINQFHLAYAPRIVYGSENVAHAHAHAHNELLQVALDVGLLGLVGYLGLHLGLLIRAAQAARARATAAGAIAAGAGMSLVALHLFGVGDAIALGAKVGLFLWVAAGLILAAWRLQRADTVQR